MKVRIVVVLLLAASGAAGQDMPLTQVLLPNEGWRPIKGSFQAISGLASDSKGTIFLADPVAKQIHRLALDGSLEVHTRTTAAVQGLAVGPGDQLFACQPEKNRIVRIVDGKEELVVEKLAAHDLVITASGDIYCTAPSEQAIYLVSRDGKKRRVDQGITRPTGITLWPDQGTLLTADGADRYLWTYRVEPTGALSCKDRYYQLRARPKLPSHAGGITVDQVGRAYVASEAGVQIFDPTGRLCGVLVPPQRDLVSDVVFGGADRSLLYAACGNGLYVRKTKVKGIAVLGKR